MVRSFALSVHVYVNNVQVGEELSGGWGWGRALRTANSGNSLSKDKREKFGFREGSVCRAQCC